MRLGLSARAERLLGRLPRPTATSALELALLALIAVQAARLFWTLVTPLGPLGDWKAPAAFAPTDASMLSAFDPFFRLSGGSGPAVVTGLDLKLYGVREDRATGRGSAIIALPDGTQQSFAVGDEIMPGVTLAEVGFDNVTISRNGSAEQIFLDQSPSAETADDAAPPSQAIPAAEPAAEAPPLRFEPRIDGGQADGISVSPGGDGGRAFRAAGFAPGDVIVEINGQRVTSTSQAELLARQSGGEINLVVERGGRRVPMRVRFGS